MGAVCSLPADSTVAPGEKQEPAASALPTKRSSSSYLRGLTAPTLTKRGSSAKTVKHEGSEHSLARGSSRAVTDTGGDVHREVAHKPVQEVLMSQVATLRKEFESISAPTASMSFTQINKFQARMIRRNGDQIFKALHGDNKLRKATGKHTEKDVREQARRTSIQVWRSLGLWDDTNKEAYEGTCVTFDEYMLVVFSVRATLELRSYDAASYGCTSVLKHAGLHVDPPEAPPPPALEHPSCGRAGTVTDLEAGAASQGVGGEEGGELPLREGKLVWGDKPSSEELEEEWREAMTQIRKLEEGSGEAAALKNKRRRDDDEKEGEDDKPGASGTPHTGAEDLSGSPSKIGSSQRLLDGSDLPAGHVGHDAGGDETSGGDAHCSEGLGGEGQGDEEEDVRNEPKVKAREGLEALRFYELQEDEREYKRKVMPAKVHKPAPH